MINDKLIKIISISNYCRIIDSAPGPTKHACHVFYIDDKASTPLLYLFIPAIPLLFISLQQCFI